MTITVSISLLVEKKKTNKKRNYSNLHQKELAVAIRGFFFPCVPEINVPRDTHHYNRRRLVFVLFCFFLQFSQDCAFTYYNELMQIACVLEKSKTALSHYAKQAASTLYSVSLQVRQHPTEYGGTKPCKKRKRCIVTALFLRFFYHRVYKLRSVNLPQLRAFFGVRLGWPVRAISKKKKKKQRSRRDDGFFAPPPVESIHILIYTQKKPGSSMTEPS